MASKKSKTVALLNHLNAFAEDDDEINVIIETPKGSRNKFNYDEELQLFKLGGVLPAGASFPFDFGFVPATLGGDGDPLDVLVLMDEPAFTGCLVVTRLIGVIEAEQTERDGETTRNDRLIGVAADARAHSDVRTIEELNDNLLDEIEHFFVSYNVIKGKEFKPRGRFGPERARKVIQKGVESFRRKREGVKKRKGRAAKRDKKR
ncbi:MAG: inorganic diphosphatase [Pyrinomonadaceae bacterium]|nr:inorganic diphosphatase [Pyrinomonadaceae bacterium]